MPTLWLDLETYSEADLPTCGTYVYADHPTTEITLFAYAIDTGPVQVWDLTQTPEMPGALQHRLADPDTVLISHNANFDRTVLNAWLTRRTEATTPLQRWQCSMVKALCHALPGSLDELGKALGLATDQRKLADGRRLVTRFCKPTPANHKVRRYTQHTHPEEWARFVEYARRDVETMRTIWSRIPSLNWTHDRPLWHLDQAINDRGFAVDTELAAAGARAAEREKAHLAARFRELTGGLVAKPSQREQALAYLNARYALGLPDLTKDTLQHALKTTPDMDPVCRELLEIRLAANKTSTAKYAALAAALGIDGRFRGGLQFAGAGRTRRFAGRIFQPQNLPSRGLPPNQDIETYIGALKADVHDLLFDDLMRLGAAAIRGLVIAPPGKKLAVADLSNIEGRILAWVARELWKLDAFRAYDAGTGPDLYNITAVSIIGGDPWKVPKKVRNVFGKVPDLASGYMGGVPGYQQFAHAYGVRMADSWDTIQAMVDSELVSAAQASVAKPHAKRQITELEISETEWMASEACKLAWRSRHPATVAFWRTLQDAAINAVLHPRVVYHAGPISAVCRDKWLCLHLPSGRYLTYYDPTVVQGDYGPSLTYMSMASDEGGTSRAWIRTYTHGGKLTGNVVQTLAGDLLKDSLPAIEAAGYAVVLSVHDELVCEVPDTEHYTSDHLAAMMATHPSWAPDLPLAAAGFEAYRYKKDD